jgi:hypothetical protein
MIKYFFFQFNSNAIIMLPKSKIGTFTRLFLILLSGINVAMFSGINVATKRMASNLPDKEQTRNKLCMVVVSTYR